MHIFCGEVKGKKVKCIDLFVRLLLIVKMKPMMCVFGLQKIRTLCSMARPSPLRRAVLYVPGDDLRKLNKARSLDADCIAMDCEDGVASNRKKNARDNIRSLLDEGSILQLPSEWCVRVNSVESGLCEEDLSAVLGGDRTPPTLLLPKVESTDHVRWFSDRISSALRGRSSKIDLVLYIESARAVLRLPDICAKAEELSRASLFRPAALVFGSDDLCASLGVTRTTEANELLYARQKLVLVAKAFGLQAIDMVHIEYQDLEGLRRQCEAGAGMGYTGKQVIHPAQVPVAQAAFLPAPASVQRARAVVEAFRRHQAEGKGAFTYEGSMIDMPTVLQARRVLEVATSAKNK
ncbi:citramalyl-CoA lyase, mitochondrial-like isoform X1 [Bacillus rossius redtenbacheri]|uniref:citramalyl-CoA lyase, mitochondrial-like isoform X1 n=1 Tax=Bacillus rossius redtenbacheri TaxID=93214 RepID=UPI002FDEBFA9